MIEYTALLVRVSLLPCEGVAAAACFEQEITEETEESHWLGCSCSTFEAGSLLSLFAPVEVFVFKGPGLLV